MPADVRDAITAALSDAAVKERQDIQSFNEKAQAEMQAAGIAFNKVDTKPFRDALRTAGFYSEWKTKFGAEAWSLLEKSVGQL